MNRTYKITGTPLKDVSSHGHRRRRTGKGIETYSI
jgi:hypothetical protein